MIRLATVQDLPEVANLAEEFRRRSPLAITEFVPEMFCALWGEVFDKGIGVILVSVKDSAIVGAIAGTAHREPYNARVVLQEWFWIVEDGSRGDGIKLYRAFERWGKEQKCDEIRMAYMLDSMPEKLKRFYEHAGFKPREVSYFKELL